MNRILTALLLVALSFAASAEVWQARYGVAETFNFKLYNADGTLDIDEADGGTEVSLSCNEGAETTATNDFVDEGTFYSIALTATEMQCERIAVVVAATTTEVFFIQTHSNASAMTPANDSNLVNIAGSAVSTSTAQLGVNVVNAGGTAWGSGAITAGSIATDAITSAKIAADAIGASELAADAIGAAEVANAAIDAATFASGAIDATAIATDAIGAAEIAADAIGAAEIAANAIAAAEVADGAIDEATFATTAGSFDALGIVDQGTALAATSTTLQLRSAAAFADDEIIGATCLITGGSAGVGQARTITDYVSSTDTATVATWTTTPTGTITYQCFGTAAASGGSGATAAEVWAYGDRQLTAFDEDVTTIDINATATGAAASVTGAVGSVASGGITAASIATDAIGAAEIAADAGTELGTATWASTTRLLTAGTNIVLAKGTGVTGFNDPAASAIADAVWDEVQSGHVTAGTFGAYLDAPVSSGAGGGLDAAGVRAAIGLATANLDVQLSGIQSDTDALQSAIAALNNLSSTQVRDLVIEDQGAGVTLGCALSVILAYASGDVVTTGTNSTYEDPSGTETRTAGTVTSNGNRAATITCPTY